MCTKWPALAEVCAIRVLIVKNVFRYLASPVNDLAAIFGELTTRVGQVDKLEEMAYLLGKPNPCQTNQFLVICVHSAPEHHNRRQAVRSTWGNVTHWSVILLCFRPKGGALCSDDHCVCQSRS